MSQEQAGSKQALLREIEQLRRRISSLEEEDVADDSLSAAECEDVLERTRKEMKAFSYSISHDLRAPLRSLNGFSQILMEDYSDRLDELGLEYLQKIRSASQKMHGMIDDLLTLSRLGQMEMQRRHESLSEMAIVALENLARMDKERQVEVHIQAGVEAEGDSNLLSILLDNLLCNAWKFTRDNPTASIDFGEMQLDGERVFYVRDNGIGFDMKNVDKLYGPFQRLHNESQYPGSGIGLANAQRIVDRHHGRLWAEAEPDKGAMFYFTLG